METTYKLIKTYPRSPKIGTISTTAEWEDASKYPEFWQPVKEKFFTTQDGVDIFEGNTYWTVNTEQFSILK